MNKQEAKAQLKSLAAVRGIDRKNHFENGGDLVTWRGGARTIRVDRKKKRNKRKCRGRVQIPRE
jgi:hypothetical protein